MKCSESRAASPTLTAFSGISNHRTDSYKSISENATSVPQIDYRSLAPPNSRSTARQKLSRLTIRQSHELSTDVYDELIRRKSEKEVPFLQVRAGFHPKRNQARQKLATLSTSRFEDLSSDVYFELARRYPEFKEDREELRLGPIMMIIPLLVFPPHGQLALGHPISITT
ncbi:hypothetical protein GGU10DRAFT_139160 [Lentinula aff. detonsa]|uniref:GIT Spa2 homology (SHD) domain-containing protein n=1 Tax=Lentinula aff. detonsa TaxID=2804958 RepID=A0AA38KWN3_9AGAR|nr:hypothetical protein GGU10DRAFT_139160 [Lentinula aff. detonsa]